MAQQDERTRLVSDLEELAELLASVGEDSWALRLGTVRGRISDGDRGGLHELIEMIGGPGDDGLNDLVIHPLRGHVVDEEDLDEVNQRLGLLTTTCFRLARVLLRSP